MARCLAECHRVLTLGGRLVFSLDHPFRDCFWDEEDNEHVLFPVRSYFDTRPTDWRFDGHTGATMRTYHRTTAQWIDLLAEAGFRLVRLLEPPPPPNLADDPWATDYDTEIVSKVPQVIIFVAER
jgi:SAM-dependent methyltransferase